MKPRTPTANEIVRSIDQVLNSKALPANLQETSVEPMWLPLNDRSVATVSMGAGDRKWKRMAALGTIPSHQNRSMRAC